MGFFFRTESSTQGPLTGDRADIIWETQSQVYIENTTKSCAYVTQHQKTGNISSPEHRDCVLFDSDVTV